MQRTNETNGIRAATWPTLAAIGAALVAAVTAAIALQATARGAVGNPTAGRSTFVSTCGACHKFRAAGTSGTIGPDLDRVKLSEAALVKAISNRGASVMSRKAVDRYPTRMTAYKRILSPTQIRDVAAFVRASTHATATPTATLSAAGHAPKVGARWHYTVRVTSSGKPMAARLTVQVIDPTGHAQPVQLGTSGKNITNHPFKGTFADFVVWPASSRGIPLTLRATVRAGSTKKTLQYHVTPRR